MDIQEFVSSLRELADWYEQHPTIPIPYDCKLPMFVFLHFQEPEEVRAVLREIGSFEKKFDGEDFDAIKAFGAMSLRFHTKREQVCTPRVVGRRMVETKVIPAQFEPEKVIAAHEEDVIEWDCEPILKDAPAEQPAYPEPSQPADILTDEEIPF